VQNRASISAVLIIKNEGHVLEECLRSVAWADEVIVVDSGSSDNSLEIAQRYTEKIFHEHEWNGFGVQRQRAQRYATADWILMIDADERVTPELRASIELVLSENSKDKAYKINILPWVFGRFIRHGGWYPAPKVRLYPREAASYGDERVHEKLKYNKSVAIMPLEGDLLHYTYRDLRHYLTKSANYAEEWSEQRYRDRKKTSLMQAFAHGSWYFIRMYFIKAGFLDRRQGLLLALLSAHSVFVKYAALWVKRNDHKK